MGKIAYVSFGLRNFRRQNATFSWKTMWHIAYEIGHMNRRLVICCILPMWFWPNPVGKMKHFTLKQNMHFAYGIFCLCSKLPTKQFYCRQNETILPIFVHLAYEAYCLQKIRRQNDTIFQTFVSSGPWAFCLQK
jgi:hypothetical protein